MIVLSLVAGLVRYWTSERAVQVQAICFWSLSFVVRARHFTVSASLHPGVYFTHHFLLCRDVAWFEFWSCRLQLHWRETTSRAILRHLIRYEAKPFSKSNSNCDVALPSIPGLSPCYGLSKTHTTNDQTLSVNKIIH